MPQSIVVGLLFIALVTPAACSQNNPAANLPLVPLGPHDFVTISVLGVSELSRSVRIGEDGTFRLPLLAEPFQAKGKMPATLEKEITAALQSKELVVDPMVTVTVAEYVSRPVTIAGAVRNPS